MRDLSCHLTRSETILSYPTPTGSDLPTFFFLADGHLSRTARRVRRRMGVGAWGPNVFTRASAVPRAETRRRIQVFEAAHPPPTEVLAWAEEEDGGAPPAPTGGPAARR